MRHLATLLLLAFQDPVAVVPAVVAPVATGYTAAEILMFFGATGVLISGLGAAIVNIVVALRTGTKIDDAAKKTDGLVAKVEQVHILTNSNLSAVKAELSTATSQIQALRDLVTDLKSERNKADVAHALATPVPVTARTDSRAGDAPVVEVLGKIEHNTKEAVEV